MSNRILNKINLMTKGTTPLIISRDLEIWRFGDLEIEIRIK